MKKRLPFYANLMFYIILFLVLGAGIFSYFLPVENRLEGKGIVSYKGQPEAVSVGHGGLVKKILVQDNQWVKESQGILTVSTQTLSAQTKNDFTINLVGAPREGVFLWEQEIIPGDLVTAGQRLGLIYPDARPEVTAFFPEKEWGRIKAGLPVRITLDAYPQQEYGSLEGVVKSVSLANQTAEGLKQIKVKVELVSSIDNVELLRGLSAKVEIIMENSTLLDKFFF